MNKKEQDIKDLYNESYLVFVDNKPQKMTIPQLNKLLGLPQAVAVYNRMEARTGSSKLPFIIVERYADGKLRYKNGTTIKGIKKSILPLLDYSGIKTVYVRKENYDPERMPKATQTEIERHERENLKKVHNG